MRLTLLIISAFLILAVTARVVSAQIIMRNKLSSAVDIVMPFLFHDPIRTIKFHISRSIDLYATAQREAKSNPTEALFLAIRAQNHLTLIESNIRNAQNPKDVPYIDIWTVFEKTVHIQNALLTDMPGYQEELRQLQSFERRTEIAIKKIYYESLLP